MSTEIKDGSGNCYGAKVDAENRLHTGTISRTERDAAIADGRLFITNSTLIELTDAVDTPIYYIKNTDATRNLYLDIFDITVGTSTGGGSGDILIKTWAGIDETNSTLVTNARTALVGNGNTQSTKTFVGDVFYGAPGDTIVGGANFNNILLKSTDSRYTVQTSAVFIKGANAAFSVTAPTGNTSMKVSLLFIAYYLDAELPE